jgi:quercetin dioxygenase-like cupin family protein
MQGMRAAGHIIRAAALPGRELRDGWAIETEYVGAHLGANAVSMRVYRLRPHGGPGPYHMHTNSESVYFVLAGKIRVRLDGDDHLLGEGDLAFIPPEIPHSVQNDGAEDALIIELYAPANADFVHLPAS